MNDGTVESNFHIDNKFSKTVKPGETSVITVAYPLPIDQHAHSKKVEVCVGGYLSFERCGSVECTYTETEAPEIDAEKLWSNTSKVEDACLPAFLLFIGGFGFLKRF